MIYRQYGTSYQSVDLNFDAKALNEVGFRRNRQDDFPVDELGERFTLIETHEITADATGSVQSETEQLLLDRVQEQVEALLPALPEGGIVVIDTDSGNGPKTRQVIKNVVEHGENRLHFEYTLDPPLRVATWAPSA